MNNSFYDRKGIAHSSEGSRDRANARYTIEEREAQLAQERQAKLAQEQVRLVQQSLIAQQLHSAQSIAEQEEQTALLRQQVQDEQAHLQFQKDIAWLERSDAMDRFNYLSEKAQAEAIPALAKIVFLESRIAEMPAPEKLINSLVDAINAKSQLQELMAQLDEIRNKLEEARKEVTKGSAQTGVVCYFGFLPIITSAIAVATLPQNDSSLTFSRAAVFFLAGLLITSPLALKILKALRKQHRARMTAFAAQRDLAQQIAAAEKKASTLEKQRASTRRQANYDFSQWADGAKACLRRGFDSALSKGLLAASFQAAVRDKEKQYPPALRIDWEKVPLPVLVDSISLSAEAIVAAAAQSRIGFELLIAQLACAGQDELAVQVNDGGRYSKAGDYLGVLDDDQPTEEDEDDDDIIDEDDPEDATNAEEDDELERTEQQPPKPHNR